MIPLDDIDRKILNLLQDNARLTVQEIADRVGLSSSPCHRRMRQLGIIEVCRLGQRRQCGHRGLTVILAHETAAHMTSAYAQFHHRRHVRCLG